MYQVLKKSLNLLICESADIYSAPTKHRTQNKFKNNNMEYKTHYVL